MYLSTLDLALVVVAQHVLIAISVGFTKPGSMLRALSLPLSVALMLLSESSSKKDNDMLTLLLVATTPVLVLHHLNIVLLRRWDFVSAGPQPRDAGKKQVRLAVPDTVWNRFAFGLSVAISRRHCGQPFELDNVPHFRKQDPDFVPSRRRFLIERGLLYFSTYIVLDYLGSLKPQNDPGSADTAMEQVAIAVMLWAAAVPYLTMIFAFPGWVLVLLGLSEPKYWRPVFNFEHGSAIRRYTLIVLSFAVSGLLHMMHDFGFGVPFQESRSMFFFLSQAFAIMVEDAVAHFWKALTRGGSRPDAASNGLAAWQVWTGRLWVFLVLVYTTSPWAAPRTLHYEGDLAAMPFPIFSRRS
ncbi:uncharacterized protein MYCGRDRAFT_92063 [Zymoseptoria tritici IPO323]|uniref:Wax synthase domain-containing protein n=1 Tax=Zymoseptoria tritici (strain CBS 115943 / IPO323) TaxID=336722 RepID=F9X6F2_ZYMTI|nr:uncharacterized protein MYCGRDRAFT_92063 [Zymoseptoria tritici IPO323]EGP89029.1 hypothetical protein MYCGRDRAFT_92063 [Zymoseptoria tritici IPO323]